MKISLREYLDTKAPSFVQLIGYAVDATKGLEYLHTCIPFILHRDLKSCFVSTIASAILSSVCKMDG